MIQYRTADTQDREEILDFINMVFSMLRVPHNFETMLPKAYSKEIGDPGIHVLAEEDGRIRGCLGMYVFPLRIGNRTLRVGYLGSMSVHPRARGQGVMGELMRRQIERGYELGLDMMLLGGQRQRYQYSGFETVGTTYTYGISKANVRHTLNAADSESIRFRDLDSDDIPQAFDLYERQLVAGARKPENFSASISSYHKIGTAILKNNQFIGYACSSEDRQSISEILIDESENLQDVLRAWFDTYGVKYLHIQAAPYDMTLHQVLAPICESFSVGPSCMMKVLNFENVITAYLQLKQRYMPLQETSFTIGWGNHQRLTLRVSEAGADAQQTDLTADLMLENDRQFCQLLFDCNPYTLMEKRGKIPNNWLPLPFHISEPDTF